VTNLLRLLNLTPKVREMLGAGELEMGHARALLSLDASRQAQAAAAVVDRQLSVRQTEALARQLLNPAPRAASKPAKSADTRRLEQDLTERVGAPVSIDHDAAGKGQLVIRYTTLDELEGILGHLR
jgi:ParB family chromosome partitioning protein